MVWEENGGHPNPRRKEHRMAHHNTTPPAASLEEAVTVLFCLVDDAYRLLNPRGDGYGALKSQEALGLGGHNPRPFPAAQGYRVRALVRARRRALLLAPVPGGGGAAPLLFPPPDPQTTALAGAFEAHVGCGSCGRPRDVDRGLDAAFGLAPQAGRAVRRLGGVLLRRGVGKVGHLLGVGREAAPHLLEQPRAHLLRADRRQLRRRAPRARAPGGSGPRGGRSRPQTSWGPGLPKRGAAGRTGRGRRFAGNRKGRPTPEGQAAGGGLLCGALSRAPSGWTGRWRARWWGWQRGSRLRWRPTPTACMSTGSSGDRRDASRSFGPEILA